MAFIRSNDKPKPTKPTPTAPRLQDIGGLLNEITIPNSPTIPSLPPILRIPAEVRAEIYRYLLPSSTKRFRLIESVHLGASSSSNNPSSTRILTTTPTPKPPRSTSTPLPSSSTTTTLSILLTSHHIYHEALSVLYSENLFHFIGFNYVPALDFIRRLGPLPRSKIRQVRMTLIPDVLTDRTSRADEMDLMPLPGHVHFCKVVHEYCPGLTSLVADPYVYL